MWWCCTSGGQRDRVLPGQRDANVETDDLLFERSEPGRQKQATLFKLNNAVKHVV